MNCIPVHPQQTHRLSALGTLVTSWRRHLQAANLSPKTIKSYLASVDQLEAFLVEAGMTTDVTSPHREHIETFIVHLTETRSASTAATRYRGLQQFFKWLVEEGEIRASPMARMRPPKLEEKQPIVVLTVDDQLAPKREAIHNLERDQRSNSPGGAPGSVGDSDVPDIVAGDHSSPCCPLG
jgi:site-specific recombinase XerD